MAKKKKPVVKTERVKSAECYYTIETVAQLVSLSPESIRYYEERGLIQSKVVGEKGVLYSRKEIAILKRVKLLTEELEVNLPGVEIILNLLARLEKEES